MSDNTALNLGAGGDVIATDDLSTLNGTLSSGVKIQRIKVTFGADGDARDVEANYPLPTRIYTLLGLTSPGQATMANSLPVALASDQAALPVTTSGNVASATVDSGNPVKIGGVFRTARPTFTNGQRGDAQIDANGNLCVTLSFGSAVMRGDGNGLTVQSAPSTALWSYPAATGGIVNTATAVTLHVAAGAGLRNYLKTLTIGHDALGGATEIAVRDGAGGTVLWRGKLQTAAAEDRVFKFDPPLQGTANTLMEFVTLTAVTGGVFANASGFTGI